MLQWNNCEPLKGGGGSDARRLATNPTSDIRTLDLAISSRALQVENYDDAFIRAIIVSAIAAGVWATATPAALSASILPAAVPLPPETIAPA